MDAYDDNQLDSQQRPRVLRRVVRVTVAEDPETGLPMVIPVEHERLAFATDGALETTLVHHQRFYKCGCDTRNPPGSRCVECGGVSCARCQERFGRCCLCLSPVCPEHAKLLSLGGQRQQVVCRQCLDAIQRRRRLKGLVRTALSPFIRFTPTTPTSTTPKRSASSFPGSQRGTP